MVLDHLPFSSHHFSQPNFDIISFVILPYDNSNLDFFLVVDSVGGNRPHITWSSNLDFTAALSNPKKNPPQL